jgi:hypothetical protein
MERDFTCTRRQPVRHVARPMAAPTSWRAASLMMLVTAGGMFVLAPSLEGQSLKNNAPEYLALGDSYPFGSRCDTTPCVAPENLTGLDSAKNDNFYVGYPDYLQLMIDRPLINAGCPGEFTSSFLTLGGLGGQACPKARELGLLHIEYAGSQMEFAEDYLTTNARVQLITLQLGGPQTNKFFSDCAFNPTCIMNGLPAHTAWLVADLTEILSRLRGTGYSGPIIFVEYPSTNYNSFGAQILPQLYQAVLPTLQAYGVQKAPIFDVFRVAALPFGGNSCAAGLLITTATGGCNVHPTPAGHQLIASTLAGMVQLQ